jgi:hypothetical protein
MEQSPGWWTRRPGNSLSLMKDNKKPAREPGAGF